MPELLNFTLIREYHVENEMGILLQQCHYIPTKCFATFSISWMQDWGDMNFNQATFLRF